jgi:hypothetical protein
MSDPIEAVARAIYQGHFDKAKGGVKNSFLEVARAAIDAYHAAQPSDYAELKRDARARDDETSDKLVDAIENLEADNQIAWAAAKKNEVDAINGLAHRKLSEKREAERDALKAEVAELENRFRHYHVSQGNSTDACAECGLDVRDKIHTRAELEKDK